MLQHPAVLLWGDCSHVNNLTPTFIRVLAGNGWHLPKGLIEGTVTEVQVGLTGPVVHSGALGTGGSWGHSLFLGLCGRSEVRRTLAKGLRPPSRSGSPGVGTWPLPKLPPASKASLACPQALLPCSPGARPPSKGQSRADKGRKSPFAIYLAFTMFLAESKH